MKIKSHNFRRNYDLNYYDGLPQIENIQARLCWIDNTADIWGKTYETSDNISIKYSKCHNGLQLPQHRLFQNV